MIYTNGIRKIFNTNGMGAGSLLEDSFSVAEKAGYEALSFNSLIYVYDPMQDTWRSTCFTLNDFEAK